MGRTVLVSHRLPFTAKFQDQKVTLNASVGGLATGLLPMLTEDSLWIGWSGLSQKLPKKHQQSLEAQFTEQHCLTVNFPVESHRAFLSDVCNGVIWPLYHYQVGVLPVRMPGWKDYVAINRSFADRILESAKDGDELWIHDYHLQLLPQILRDRGYKGQIGFFLHIPFPAYEIFRILPWRHDILRGILGADLIGFHTESYCQHFLENVQKLLGLDVSNRGVRLSDRQIEVDAFPLGVDVNTLESTDEGMQSLGQSLRTIRQDGERRLFMSVDRMDYTKGLARKILAFEHLLDTREDLRGKLTLVQIAPPSRDEVPAYTRFRRDLDEHVGRINGKYGSPDYQPVQYLARSYHPQEIFQAYKEVDVMLVTPVRDGMNLVAKEFVAARNDEDGVLVLSELAGAASELFDALPVNPYDIEQMSQVFYEAVTMPEADRRARMRAMRERVLPFSTVSWAKDFLSRLKTVRRDTGITVASPTAIAREIAATPKPIRLYLDYDGTLFPIVRLPDMAVPDQSLRQLLTRLARHPRCDVHIVSGRSMKNLQRWFPALPITLHAEHGAISSNGKMVMDPQGSVQLLERCYSALQDIAQRYPGARVERKTYGSTFHYRNAENGEQAAANVLAMIREEFKGEAIDILKGKKNVEIRLQGINKGAVLKQAESDATVVAIGDDVTDEDMFAAVPESGVTIAVGSQPSHARYRLRDSNEVRTFLRELDQHLAQ